MLILAEAANWGFPAEHMENPLIREKFQHQMREMVESSWNHPSVIGWSVGNEYESWTPAGLAWTKDMKAFVRTLDESRPIVFVALGGACKRLADDVKGGAFVKAESSFHYSDILCPNIYAAPDEAVRWLDVLHEVWPDKPVFITEYGKRTDQVKDEAERVAHFEKMLDLVRSRDFVCGLSYWAMADYRSRYPGTNANGYRPWGIVDAQRTPRELYGAMRKQLMPVIVKSVDPSGVIELVGRRDFPSTHIHNARVRITSTDGAKVLAEQTVDLIVPGVAVRAEVPWSDGAKPPSTFRVDVLSADGVVVGRHSP
jgi:beta-glucuronidase